MTSEAAKALYNGRFPTTIVVTCFPAVDVALPENATLYNLSDARRNAEAKVSGDVLRALDSAGLPVNVKTATYIESPNWTVVAGRVDMFTNSEIDIGNSVAIKINDDPNDYVGVFGEVVAIHGDKGQVTYDVKCEGTITTPTQRIATSKTITCGRESLLKFNTEVTHD